MTTAERYAALRGALVAIETETKRGYGLHFDEAEAVSYIIRSVLPKYELPESQLKRSTK